MWKGTDFDKTCGDCIHADICEHNLSPEFSRENIAWCNSFKDTADVVEVVRCEKCKYGESYDDGVSFVCNKDAWATAVHGDHFCSYGEPKDGAE